MTSLVTVEQYRSYAVVRLNRPEKKNALNRAARRDLLAALTSLRATSRVIVLTGCGDSFCSGVDLKEARADAEAGTPSDLGSDWIEVLIAIREHPAIFIAAVNGLALGGGATLISVCDLAVAAHEAEIGMPEIGFGAYPQFSGPGAQIQLTAKRAAWLVLTAQRIDGLTAETWGMVNRSVPLAGLMDEAERIAKVVSAFDAVALSESKRALDAIPASISGWRQSFEYGLSTNARIQLLSAAQYEGLSRFSLGEQNPGQGRLTLLTLAANGTPGR
jgi:enoyl-CoA hydratase/carnithine racemase